ncbi:hypothetical protein PAPHI01_0330 [Pancytospora philotis]|nr:hypothetical protein PAPHI01_0330 [Pancytospora philotis]
MTHRAKSALDAGSLNRALQSLRTPIRTTSSDIFVNPDGPLNAVCAHLPNARGLLAKKRKFSPFIDTSYRLFFDESRGDYAFVRKRKADKAYTLGSSRKMKYLAKYHGLIVKLYKLSGKRTSIVNGRSTSFYQFLHEHLTSGQASRFLACLLVLASGGEMRVEYEHGEGEGANTTAVIFKNNSGGDFLRVETVMRDLKEQEEPKYFRTAVSIVKFVARYGARSPRLCYSDKPRFLVQLYAFDFADRHDSVSALCGAVSEAIATAVSDDTREKIWRKCFTHDAELVRQHADSHDALERLARLSEPSGQSYAQICDPVPFAGTAYGLSGDSHSDSLESVLLNLCLAILYDYPTRTYQLRTLDKEGFTPTAKFRHFFTEICTSPDARLRPGIYEEWARVVGCLWLTRNELETGVEGASGPNLISYCKSTDGRRMELRADMLNMLFVMAKILGLPDDLRSDLVEAYDCLVSDNDPRSKNGLSALLELVSSIIYCLSSSSFEIKQHDFKMAGNELHGSFRANMRSRVDMGDEGHSSLNVCLTPGRVSFTASVAEAIYRRRDKAKLKEYLATSTNHGTFFTSIVHDEIQKFFRRGKFMDSAGNAPRSIGLATNAADRYKAISQWLDSISLDRFRDKLAVLDQLVPLLDAMTARGTSAYAIYLDAFKEWARCCADQRELELDREGPLTIKEQVAIMARVIASRDRSSASDVDEILSEPTRRHSNLLAPTERVERIIEYYQASQRRPEEPPHYKPLASGESDASTRSKSSMQSSVAPIDVHDPLILFISNIVGSMPLGNKNERSFVLTMLCFAHEERQRLFPKIQVSTHDYLLLSDLGFESAYSDLVLKRCSVPNTAVRCIRNILALPDYRSLDYFRGFLNGFVPGGYQNIFDLVLGLFMRLGHREGRDLLRNYLGFNLDDESYIDNLVMWHAAAVRFSNITELKFVYDQAARPDFTSNEEAQHTLNGDCDMLQHGIPLPILQRLIAVSPNSLFYVILFYTKFALPHIRFPFLETIFTHFYSELSVRKILIYLKISMEMAYGLLMDPGDLPNRYGEFLDLFTSLRDLTARMKDYWLSQNALNTNDALMLDDILQLYSRSFSRFQEQKPFYLRQRYRPQPRRRRRRDVLVSSSSD